MRAATQETIAASENDLRNNRLGLLSAAQIAGLQQQIDAFQERSSHVVSRSVMLAAAVTLGLVALTFIRIILLPIALTLEIVVVAIMVVMTTNLNRFLQQLELDIESESVRIIKGRASRFGMRTHPLYHTLRVELDTYRLLDPSLPSQFATGELYQLYILPHSGVIIAAERVGEKEYLYLG